MKDEIHLAQSFGQPVHFTCIDVGKSSKDDFQFKARCHFIPRVGERVGYGQKVMEVIGVIYRAVKNENDGGRPVMVPNVLCRYIGEAPSYESLVKELLLSLQEPRNGQPSVS